MAALSPGNAIGVAWLGFAGLLTLAYATRMLFVGVFVNDDGMLVRYFWRSIMLPWSQISGVRVEPSSIRTVLWRANPALWVTTGAVVQESPMVRGGSWLLPSFGGGFSRLGRVYLSTGAFDTLLRDLQGELAKHRVRP
jgi:hypothetical protein